MNRLSYASPLLILTLLSIISTTYSSSMQCSDYNCCDINKDNGCMLSTLLDNATTLIFPGGDTRCILSSSTPYAFEVHKGSKEKILFYFQGGGSCWDEESTQNSGSDVKNTRCRTDAVPWPVYGVFDRSDPRNAFAEYTIVNVLYCSGDNHAGNVQREYLDNDGGEVIQRGIANVEAVLTWVQNQQSSGELSKKLSDLVVMGCSAGSIASQVWGNEVVKRLNYPQRAAIVLDSYLGLFPADIQGPLIREFGMCDISFLSDEFRSICEAGNATLMNHTFNAMAASPHVPYLFIHSAYDRVQIKYYNYVAESYGYDNGFGSDGFEAASQAVFAEYNTLSNFLVYYINSNQHCYTPTPYLFFANTDGISGYETDDANDDGTDDSVGGNVDDDSVMAVDITEETLNKWVSRLPLWAGQDIYSQCAEDMCSEDVIPKRYIQYEVSSDSGNQGEGYVKQSEYSPSRLVRNMHQVPHLNSDFETVDSTFNITHNIGYSEYTASLVTVPVLVYVIGIFAVLVFLFALLIRSMSRGVKYSKTSSSERGDLESRPLDMKTVKYTDMAPPIELVQAFLGCLFVACFLNFFLFMGNVEVSRGTDKGDAALYHLQYSFEDLMHYSDSLQVQGANLTDQLTIASEDGCEEADDVLVYMDSYDEYIQEFDNAVSPVEPKVARGRRNVNNYAVEKKNGFVFTVFTVSTLCIMSLWLSSHLRSVCGLKFSIGLATFVVLLSLIFCTLYMIFLIALADFCMDPTTYVLSMIKQGSTQETVKYYATCSGVSPASEYLYGAEYTTNVMEYFVGTLASDYCVDNTGVLGALSSVRYISSDINAVQNIADCAPYKEYWERFFHEGACSNIFEGMYIIWISQTLAALFLFAAAVLASVIYPYYASYHKQVETQLLMDSSHDSLSSTESSTNVVIEMNRRSL